MIKRRTLSMFVLKRNQVIITALVIMIAVAGYLNWLDSRDNEPGIALTDQGEIAALVPDTQAPDTALAGTIDNFESGYTLGNSTNEDAYLAYTDEQLAQSIDEDPLIASDYELYDGSSAIALPSEDENLTEAGEAVFVNTSSDSSYFVQAKLNREQARASEKEILTDIINNTNVESAQKAAAADSMLEIQKRIERETAAEAMIVSKGFSEVYVRIDDGSVDVVVNKEALSDAEIAQITDIIKRKTGMAENQIHISPMRK
jgi:stage III sporulation protein AH